MNARSIIFVVLGLILIVGTYFAANAIIANKKKPKPKVNKVSKTVFVEEIKNGKVPIVVPANGNLLAKRRIELYSEVQGVFRQSGRSFKTGENYPLGAVLVRLDASEYYASVQSAKSGLYNLITSIMPDLRLDYPEAHDNWQAYLANFDMNKSVPNLPKISSEQEKYFITGRNVFSTYYNVKNLEERLSKYSIRAPFSGTLIESLVTEGTLIRSGQKLGVFIDPTVFEMEVSVPAALADILKVGEKVSLSNLEKSSKFDGKLIRINASLNQESQTVSVFIEVSGENLKEGMYLEANLSAREENNAIEIARSLLQSNDQIFYVKNDSILDLMDVQPSYFFDKNVVLHGVPDGTKILSKPVPGAYAGMLVSIYNGRLK